METESLLGRLLRRMRKSETSKPMIMMASHPSGGPSAFYESCRKRNTPPCDTPWAASFIPWHEFPDSGSETPDGFSPTRTEVDLSMKYRLTNEQLQWRREQIEAFGGDAERFKQEYPCDADELKAGLTTKEEKDTK